MQRLITAFLTILPFTYMGFIWFLSSHPSDEFIETPFWFDDLLKESLHLVEFGILFWLFVLALIRHTRLTQKTSVIVAIISILYGLTDEIHQAFVPSRSATVIDFIKDTIGVIVSYWVLKTWYFTKESTLKRVLVKFSK